MKLALAQIDMRLGDIQNICTRIEGQAALARRQGARLLCTPAPLFGGIAPGSLVDAENYQHDLMLAMRGLADSLSESGPTCLIPAIIPLQGSSLFEVFMLKRGRVVPLRLLRMHQREGAPHDLWGAPVFDVDGIRVAVTFDVYRDVEELPGGCDLIIYFQVNGFDLSNRANAGIAAVSEGIFRDLASKRSLWLACMAPVGGYDEAAYTGGSFVLDDAGRVAAMAPCFEEALLVQDVQRGMSQRFIEDHELPTYQQEEWLWEALRLHLRDAVSAEGLGRVVVHLTDDLPSALLALLAVDALGTRNVLAVHMGRDDLSTPAEEAAEAARASRVRELAAALRIRLIERVVSDGTSVADSDRPQRAGGLHLREGVEGLCLEDTARELSAVPLSALTKTDIALAVGGGILRGFGAVAPFGDVYLTELEFLARSRNRASGVLPASLVSLHAVEDAMERIIGRTVASAYGDAMYAERVAGLLSPLEPCEIDGVLEAHIDRNLPLEEIPLAVRNPAAVALLLLLVRRGERARRQLPLVPIVSARSFSERAWPVQLAWSDLGRHGEEALSAESFARKEMDRAESLGERQAERMRKEVMGLIGGLLGLSPEQLADLQSGEGQVRIQGEMEQMESRLREQLGHGNFGGYPFFSEN